MRRSLLAIVLLAAPGAAAAQGRLDLSSIPDVSIYDAVWPLNYQTKDPFVGSFGAGFGGIGGDGGERRPTADATGAVGYESDRFLLAARSELSGFADGADLELVRGRHRGLALLRTNDDLGFSVSLGGVLDHGEAQGLAPAHLGGGRRTTGDAEAAANIVLIEDCDCHFSLGVRGGAGATRWPDGATAVRQSVALAFGPMPDDDELPNGMLELVRGRVEHVRIDAPFALAGALEGRRNTEVRIVEVGLGAHDMTLHIDHELKAVIAADFGWSWLEADTPVGTTSTNLYRMRLSAAGTMRERDKGRLLHLGFAFARQPDYTADGSRIVADWRLEMEGGLESRRLLLAARGGLSWLAPHEAVDSAPEASTLIRYGTQLEAFLKLGSGIEVGGYHAAHFEPAPGDPWASDRRWGLEAGVQVRIRTDQVARMMRRDPEPLYQY